VLRADASHAILLGDHTQADEELADVLADVGPQSQGGVELLGAYELLAYEY
jgi:hypothetical protein